MAITKRFSRIVGKIPETNPTGVAGAELSIIYFDDHGRPNQRLIDLSLQATQAARTVDLRSISERMTTTPHWPNIWPGEHYKLLAGFVRVLQPDIVVEIGTFQGLSALALEKYLPPGGRLHTYDLIPHDEIKGCVLREEDFAEGRTTQHVADLTDQTVFEEHRDLLEQAGILFVDAAKDGKMEQIFLDRFETLRFANPPIIIFDDIRMWKMLRIWRGVMRPKLDLTSFGHWSGTGVVDWVKPES